MIAIGKKIYSDILADFGATEPEILELLAYNNNFFDRELLESVSFPLADEPFIEAWEMYGREAQEKGTFAVLRDRLVQFRFPIQSGISRTESYRSATLRGKWVEVPQAGLTLACPEKLELYLHQTLAGKIPILFTRHRPDFVTLVQALAHHNEPGEIPASMGACLIKGYNNWDRIQFYRNKWQEENPLQCSEKDWPEEFRKLIPRKELYQDTFIILSDGDYSGITAEEMKLTWEKWREMSLVIRREHEATHYFTLRVFGLARNHILDELIADFMGIIAATGSYRSHWFLRFLGLEDYPAYREGGRLENYLCHTKLSQGAFKILQRLVKSAAENLEQIYHQYGEGIDWQPVVFTGLTMIDLVSKDAEKFLRNSGASNYL
ncbi:hypothetical protein SAMN05660649_00819 [Desulfotomaculum arcticum]|uniref:Uncharacterized protein n=1 Tax=Desulfotruncus arcticus DSM 17038 TaxID=1121424 RepID=A0A1I2PBJ4_9FIRM|nr:hypothetical protein [Desulfotruncus arcticus]SFG13505.1 hypothetical protein SAMN05660649_00819 [Desulfotomaculum arcticum] [Desulfotruncus arcticus DSM 17038]